MGHRRQAPDNANVHTVYKNKPGGGRVAYRYHRITRRRIFSDPGSPEFAAEVAAAATPSLASRRPVGQKTIYFIRAVKLGHIKIGYTADMAARLRALKTASPDKLLVMATIEDGSEAAERELHHKFAAHRIHGEWFEAHPTLLDFIENLREGHRSPWEINQTTPPSPPPPAPTLATT